MENRMEKQKENKIRQWFSMWLDRQDTGILELFAPDAVYIESWGRNITAAKKSSCGLRNGIPGGRCSVGISGNISTRPTKQW